MNRKDIERLERVRSSERKDKINFLLELLMTETGDDFEIALNAAQSGENAVRELVVETWIEIEDGDGFITASILCLALDSVDWEALTRFILESK